MTRAFTAFAAVLVLLSVGATPAMASAAGGLPVVTGVHVPHHEAPPADSWYSEDEFEEEDLEEEEDVSARDLDISQEIREFAAYLREVIGEVLDGTLALDDTVRREVLTDEGGELQTTDAYSASLLPALAEDDRFEFTPAYDPSGEQDPLARAWDRFTDAMDAVLEPVDLGNVLPGGWEDESELQERDEPGEVTDEDPFPPGAEDDEDGFHATAPPGSEGEASGAWDENTAPSNVGMWSFGNWTEARQLPVEDISGPREVDPGNITFPDPGPGGRLGTEARPTDASVAHGAVAARADDAGWMEDAGQWVGSELSQSVRWLNDAFTELLLNDEDAEPIQEDEGDVQGDQEVCHWWEDCPEEDVSTQREGAEPPVGEQGGFLAWLADAIEELFGVEEPGQEKPTKDA